jgi:uncharacterized protein
MGLSRFLLPFLLLALVTACDNVGSDQAAFDRGLAAYKTKHYKAAHDAWLPLAKAGYAHAQYRIGRLFELGRGVKKDDATANGWYRKAAEQGYANAQYSLASQLGSGSGFPKDRDQEALWKEAAKWYRAAAEQGHAKAQGWIGYYYWYGRGGVPRSDTEALKWFKKGAAQNDRHSLYMLAMMQSDDGSPYNKGNVAPDDTAAARNYLKAARLGDYWAAQNLEGLFNQGRTSLSKEDMFRVFEQLAHKQPSPAQGHMARVYLEGRLTERDPAKAVPWLEKAAKFGFTRGYGFYQLAKLYLAGDSVPRDTGKAAKLLVSSAERNSMSRLMLAYLHANGDGVSRDLAQAYYWASLAIAGPQSKYEGVQDRAVRARSYFVTRMSADDLARGRELLRKRWTANPKLQKLEEGQLVKFEGRFTGTDIAMGKEALDRLLASGYVRPADRRDIEIWVDRAGAAVAEKRSSLSRIPIDRIYIVTGPITLPDGMFGSAAATFVVSSNVPPPSGPRGSNLFFSTTDFKCHPRCGLPYEKVPGK